MSSWGSWAPDLWPSPNLLKSFQNLIISKTFFPLKMWKLDARGLITTQMLCYEVMEVTSRFNAEAWEKRQWWKQWPWEMRCNSEVGLGPLRFMTYRCGYFKVIMLQTQHILITPPTSPQNFSSVLFLSLKTLSFAIWPWQKLSIASCKLLQVVCVLANDQKVLFLKKFIWKRKAAIKGKKKWGTPA